jgi:hypothetical protein
MYTNGTHCDNLNVLMKLLQPGDFLKEVWDHPNAPEKLHFAHGTTTLSFIFKYGVVVTVDSRSTQGNYIGE